MTRKMYTTREVAEELGLSDKATRRRLRAAGIRCGSGNRHRWTEPQFRDVLEKLSARPAPGRRARCLHLDADARRDAGRRLDSVRGHVEGILRMLDDEGVYCVEVLKQIKAVQGALDKVGALVLDAHLRDHVATAAGRGDAEAIVAELMEVLKYR